MSNFIKLKIFYPFWSEIAFLPDFMTTVYEPHIYLTWNSLKLTSSNRKLLVHGSKRNDKILKVKERNCYHRKAISMISFTNNDDDSYAYWVFCRY